MSSQGQGESSTGAVSRQGLTCWKKRCRADRRACRSILVRCLFRMSFSAVPAGGSLKATSSALFTSLCRHNPSAKSPEPGRTG